MDDQQVDQILGSAEKMLQEISQSPVPGQQQDIRPIVAPTGTSPTDSIVSDATLGTSITLRCLDNAFWIESQKTGTWT